MSSLSFTRPYRLYSQVALARCCVRYNVLKEAQPYACPSKYNDTCHNLLCNISSDFNEQFIDIKPVFAVGKQGIARKLSATRLLLASVLPLHPRCRLLLPCSLTFYVAWLLHC